MKELITLVFALILTIIVIYLAYISSKALARRMGGSGKSRYLKEIDRIGLGPEQFVSIVRSGDSYYMVGVTKQQITLLSEVDESQLIPIDPDDGQINNMSSLVNSDFLNKLQDRIGRKSE